MYSHFRGICAHCVAFADFSGGLWDFIHYFNGVKSREQPLADLQFSGKNQGAGNKGGKAPRRKGTEQSHGTFPAVPVNIAAQVPVPLVSGPTPGLLAELQVLKVSFLRWHFNLGVTRKSLGA